jgi:ATP/maltotriose-dependent transcriptional regulator MalT
MWRGTWLEAEQELVAATDELAMSRPGMTADGMVRLAELRRRQGRLVEAADLFEKCLPHPMASLGRGELAMERGDGRAAADEAERYLRRIPARNRVDRVAGLDLLVRAGVAIGDLDRAKTALAEMTGIAAIVATVPVRAVDLFSELHAEVDAARARKLAADYAERTAAGHVDTDKQGPGPAQSGRKDAAGLSARELEVLRLVAAGLNNQDIAERLFLSDHTIHRHVANIFSKLSVSSRAAAVAQAARRGLL